MSVAKREGSHLTEVGKFEVKPNGSIGVWDPCYGSDHEFLYVVPGTWVASYEMSDEGEWGKRVKRLSARLDGHRIKGKMTRLGVVGVDSGQMGIYALHADDIIDTSDEDYEVICKLTHPAGMLPYGVVSSSGFGDGAYEVLGRSDKAGNLVEIEVVFIPDRKRR